MRPSASSCATRPRPRRPSRASLASRRWRTTASACACMQVCAVQDWQIPVCLINDVLVCQKRGWSCGYEGQMHVQCIAQTSQARLLYAMCERHLDHPRSRCLGVLYFVQHGARADLLLSSWPLAIAQPSKASARVCVLRHCGTSQATRCTHRLALALLINSSTYC